MNNTPADKEKQLSYYTIFIVALAAVTLGFVVFVAIMNLWLTGSLIPSPSHRSADSPFSTVVNISALLLSIVWCAVGCVWALKNMIRLHTDMREMRDAHMRILETPPTADNNGGNHA